MSSKSPTTADGTRCPSIFDAGLPALCYLDAPDPTAAHRLIAAARSLAPIGVGPFGPELLSYGLVRDALADSRFRAPIGTDETDQLHTLVTAAIARRGAKRLREAFAGAIDPVPAFCAALGVPRQDWSLFAGWADDPTATDQLHAYIDVMVAVRCANLTDDLLSDLIMAECDGNDLDADEIRGLVASLMTVGVDAARTQLAAAATALSDHPDQWSLLAEHSEFAAAAAETVRHSPIHFTTTRIATEDIELAHVLIPTGTMVLLNIAAANRDPDVYDDPNSLDLQRDDAPPVGAYDAGMHCLAEHLAQPQLAEALSALVRSNQLGLLLP